MEQLIFILSILALATTLCLFIGKILTSGLGKSFDMKVKSTKVMLSSFLMYIVCYALYFSISN